jgi:antitoxin (DNA-binding transcriptional repressor) of toxin-antitoxin stability system
MLTVGIRELKDRLSEYVRRANAGEEILVTDRGRVVAELRKPGSTHLEAPYPALMAWALAGKARIGARNRADLYPELRSLLPEGQAGKLLDAERGER